MKNRNCVRGALTLLILSAAIAGYTQSRSAYLDQPSLLYPPVGMEPDKNYPLVVFLPYTGGTAEAQAVRFGTVPGAQQDFYVLLPPGRYQRSDYLPNFTQFVEWVEERVVADIRGAIADHAIDADEVYVAGYSLGGDLSWALALRNPDLIDGAVIAGTRASYPLSPDLVRRFASEGKRFSMIIGDRENADRYNGINRARSSLEDGGVEVLYREYSGGHQIPPRNTLVEGLAYVSDGSASPSATGNDRSASEPVSPSETRSGGSSSSGQGSADTDQSAGEQIAGILLVAFFNSPPSGFAALRYVPPAVLDEDTGAFDGLHQLQLRYEAFAGDVWLRGSTAYESTPTSDFSLSRIIQTAAIGVRSQLPLSIGASWTWATWFEDAVRTPARPRFSVDGHLLHRGGSLPLTGLLSASIRIPASFSPLVLPDVLNGSLSYRLEIADLVGIELSGESFAQQSAPLTSAGDSVPLDWVVRWNAGVGIRLPTRLRWGIIYTAERRAPVPVAYGDAPYEHKFQIMLELLF